MRTNKRVSAIIMRNNKVLLVHRKKQGREYWVVPGGGVEEGETIEEGLIREVKEETGFDTTSYDLLLTYKHDELEHYIYSCAVEDDKEPVLGGPEQLKNSEENWFHLEWIEKEDAKKIKDFYPTRVQELL